MFGHPLKVCQYTAAGPQPGFMMEEQTWPHHALLAMETGSFAYEIGNSRGTAGFGDFVFCPKDVNFKRKALSEVSFHVIQFDFLPDEDGKVPPLPDEVKVSISDTVRLKSTFTYLRKLHYSQRTVFPQPEHIRDRLVADLLLLCELEKLLIDNRRHADPFMKKAISYIQEYAFDPDISMQHIADRLSLHPSQLTRRFQAAYGSTPTAYLTKLRLEEAKRLLVETSDTLEMIASRCGYDSGSYFCRVFTDKIGMNPSVYRHTHWI